MFGFRSNPLSAILPLICSALSVVTAFLYRGWFIGSAEFNEIAFYLMIGASALGILAIIGLGDFAASVQFLMLLAGSMFYIYGMYYYVSIVLVGIDLQSFSTAFIACSALVGSTVVLSTLNVLIKR